MPTRERIPPALRGPVGVASLCLMLAGVTVGYVITVLGVTLYFDLNGLDERITDVEAVQVTLVGIGALTVGWLGWRGFTRFAY